MRRGWQFASLGFVALFAFAIWKSISLPLKDALGPGPGFFPLWLGIVGGLLAFTVFIEVTRQSEAEAGPGLAELVPERPALMRILAVLVLLAAAAFAFEPVGFRLTSLVFCLILPSLLGARSLIVPLPFALAASFGVFHVFYHWLKVPLPIGNFGI